MKSLIIKTILFFSLVCFIGYSLDPYFVEDKIDFRTYFAFYKKPKNSLNTITIGNSHEHCGLNSRIISGKCQINAYNLSMAGTNLNEMFSTLKEALRTQKSELVIIENFALLAPGQPQELLNKEGELIVNNPNFFYAKKTSFDKLKEANIIFNDNVYYKSFNIFRNHETWSDTETASNVLSKYLSSQKINNHYDNALGTTQINKSRAKKYSDTPFVDSITISKDQKRIIKEIISLSKENNF